MFASDYAKLGMHISAGALFVANLVLWNESGYFDVAAENKPLLHLWSLGIEEQFYIFWPLLIGFFWKREKNFLLIVLLSFAISFAINIYLILLNNQVAAFYSPLSRFWELMVGGGLAYAKSHLPIDKWFSRAAKNLQSSVGLFMIFVSIIALNRNSIFPGWWALLPTTGALLLILGGSDTWVNRNLLANKLAVSIGLISYPLYLWHWPALYIANHMQIDSPMDARIFRILAITASLALAYLTYILVEKPTRTRPTRQTTAFWTVTVVVCAVAGLLIYISGGVSSRFPKLLANVGERPIQAEWREHTCYLQPGDNRFGESCLDAGRPLFLLWGDSHAAALYPGFRDFGDKNNVGIGQTTASACPPLFNWERLGGKSCSNYNNLTLEIVKRRRPDAVVLAANWDRKTNVGYDLGKLNETVASIKSSGVNSIFLIGPVPQWNGDLPKILWKCYGNHTIPEYSKCEVSPSNHDVDLEMESISKKLDIQYISIFREMCREDGCLVRIDDKLVSEDHGHLTPAASRFLVSRISLRLRDGLKGD
jgi:peptidoglycan/LPS O-acetylase OafA/YrhL